MNLDKFLEGFFTFFKVYMVVIILLGTSLTGFLIYLLYRLAAHL